MRKLFSILAVILCTVWATAQQTDQYFWLNGKLMFGTQIAQVDSITFGSSDQVDTLHLILPRTITVIQKDTVYVEVHDTVKENVEVRDTVYIKYCLGDTNDGLLAGEFSVSATDKVHFSQGNLQYVGTWQFAEHQWDCFGTSQSDNHRDLFGWGTGKAPNKVSENAEDYATFIDWGTNRITNGGNIPEIWRTLTNDEWGYLLSDRANADGLVGLGSVNGVNGLIILPDNWVLPNGASFTSVNAAGMYWIDGYTYIPEIDQDTPNGFLANTYSVEQWSVMESAGAVFLPEAGSRSGSSTSIYAGEYWASTLVDGRVRGLDFVRSGVNPQYPRLSKPRGCAVRLVR